MGRKRQNKKKIVAMEKFKKARSNNQIDIVLSELFLFSCRYMWPGQNSGIFIPQNVSNAKKGTISQNINGLLKLCDNTFSLKY